MFFHLEKCNQIITVPFQIFYSSYMVKQNMKWGGLKEHGQVSDCIRYIILLLILETEVKLYDVFCVIKSLN